MRIYLVRHGQSQGNIDRSSPADCELSEAGREQARTVAQTLARLGVTHILASPYCRTLQTAEAIRQAAGAPAELLPAVHEYNREPFPAGPWPLATRSRIAARFPHFAAPAEMPETHWAVAGETLEAEWRRVGAAVDQLVRRFADRPDSRVAVVTHQGPGYCFIKWFLGLSDWTSIRLLLDPGSITVLELSPQGRPTILCLNWKPVLDV